MHKDSNLRKRNALVIPGGLLALYSLIGLLYVSGIRGDEGTCGDASLVVFAGACRSATLVLAIPLVIGLALVGVGALAFRNRATCRSGHGSWTHFGLAFLLSLTLIPLLAMLAAPSLVGEDAVITRGTVDYPVTTVLAAATGLGLLMLVPFVLLYAAQARANPCCREKGCFDPCFCDEPASEEPAPEPAPAVAPTVIPEAAPAPAPAPEPVAPVPPVVEPAPGAAPAWDPVAAEPAAGEWEVVPDEPAPEPSKKASNAAPALAVRPTDPAAPPADAMAVAAKWAEEDEEAMTELGRASPAGRSSRLSRSAKKPAPKPAKTVAKAAKKAKK